jgi:tRNA modification GTPase
MRKSADTIAAVATAPGRAGIGVVRVSGPAVPPIMRGLLGRDLAPRSAVLCDFLDARGEPIDRGIALYFPAPNSYTGDDVLELQGHGGGAILHMLVSRCAELGARAAEPGEFTRRAFLNDKIDLAQAEAVADLIDASSEVAARAAMRSLSGEFSARVHALTDALVELRALVEASLDFPEEDIAFVEKANARGRLEALARDVVALLEQAKQGSLVREGARVVLVGQPNVGKSSLMNRLAGEDVAIVTEIPGTTRDALKHALHVEGIPLFLVDTAGLREAPDVVEKLGIERTWREAGTADVAFVVVDAKAGITEADRALVAKLPKNTNKFILFNKIDLFGQVADVSPGALGLEIRLSAKTGAGMDLLRKALLEELGWRPGAEPQFIARERHVQALQTARAALDRAQDRFEALELFAEELRLAQQALARITGEFTADDLLGEIFSRFCIGK